MTAIVQLHVQVPSASEMYVHTYMYVALHTMLALTTCHSVTPSGALVIT